MRRDILEVDAIEAAAAAASGAALLLDVREIEEYEDAHIQGALHIPRGELPLRVAERIPDRARPIICYCAAGQRSLLAADVLLRMGYESVKSMRGGIVAWSDAGLPCEFAEALAESQRLRYARHLAIPGVGAAGQARLLAARVLVVGAGGLGSPAAMYLAAAGVGTLGIIDSDVVELSNLQRQLLHTTDRIGAPKAESARRTLQALNPEIRLEAREERLAQENAAAILGGYDVVVDGCDNFETRFLVNDVSVALGLPVVHGSIFRFEGQVSVFWPGHGPCYRCLYAAPPPPGTAPT